MKNLFILSIVSISTLFISCSKDDLVQLSQQEKDDLSFLREEEKLARDVYLFSYDKYNEEIFNNIAGSEQKHMDNVSRLLKKYSLPDPASSIRGIFSNQTLQQLYNELTLQADSSLIGALVAGTTIEDLDIRDIDLNISRTVNVDLLNTYQKLNCGSYNHMRSFTNQLTENDTTYTPQFITLEKYTQIINSPNEKCGGR